MTANALIKSSSPYHQNKYDTNPIGTLFSISYHLKLSLEGKNFIRIGLTLQCQVYCYGLLKTDLCSLPIGL